MMPVVVAGAALVVSAADGSSDSADGSLLPSSAAILADGKRAFGHWAQEDPLAKCGWTGGTFLIGVMEYYKASVLADAADHAALEYARNWSAAYDFQICTTAAAARTDEPRQPTVLQTQSFSVALPACATARSMSFDRGSNLNFSRVSSVGDCCALCRKNSKCKAFNVVNNVCYLHPEVGRIVPEASDISGVPFGKLPPMPPPAPPLPPNPNHRNAQQHDANNQLCGATFVELYLLDGKNNSTMLASTAAVLEAEIADPSTDSLWSWVDALHMAMATYSRMGNATGDRRYFYKQFANFNASVLARANGGKTAPGAGQQRPGATYGFWNKSDNLFYRDDRFLGTQVYWGRGNGWAMAALVSALEFGQGSDPHWNTYLDFYLKHAAKLKSLQFDDGAWRSSLLNVTADGGACGWGKTPRDPCKPIAETTGTANFCYGLAWGINAGLLPAAEYTPVVAKAWNWLSTTALHADGLVGNCQPEAAAPGNDIGSTSTSDFCVGQFLLAAGQVSRLATAAAPVPAGAGDGCPKSNLTTQLLFQHLNLSYPGMETVAAALKARDTSAACNAISDYYSKSSKVSWLRYPAPKTGSGRVGGQIDEVVANDTYTFVTETGRVPRNKDGGLDWEYAGPINDAEWRFELNRHGTWVQLLQAWLQTGNQDYAAAVDALVVDWTRHNLPAPTVLSAGCYTPGCIKDADPGHPWCHWRPLETGIRLVTWPTTFFGFLNAPAVKSSTRCAMIAGLAEHGKYLHAFASTGPQNTQTTQYAGLANVALMLPELNDAGVWYTQAESKILADMEAGIYADGVETEEAFSYHVVALGGYRQFYSLCEKTGAAADPRIAAKLERMYDYVARALSGSGDSPLNGDSDSSNETGTVLEAAAEFSRPDWLYIATHGKNGTMPLGSASTMFPWSGQLISRSGWELDAEWSFFRAGPFGSSTHGHQDRMHLSVRVGETHLLVDSGRFSYGGPMRPYLVDYGRTTRAHNVLILDGKEQVETPAKASAPLPSDMWSITEREDRARGSITFAGLTGKGDHLRAMAYQRGKGVWVVVDRVVSDRQRTVEGLWHAHPNTTATLDAGGAAHIYNNVSRTGLDIVPAVCAGCHSPDTGWRNATVVIGQTEPVLQGWFSPSYGTKLASPALSFTTTVGKGVSTFAWLLVATRSGAHSAAVVSVPSENATHVEVHYEYEVAPPAAGRVEGTVVVEIPTTTTSGDTVSAAAAAGDDSE